MSKALVIHVDDAVHKKFKHIALCMEKSMTSIIQEFIDAYCQTEEPPPPPTERRKLINMGIEKELRNIEFEE